MLEREAPLLARRVPRAEILVGRAYLIHARNGGIGVAVVEDGQLGYTLYREKMGNIFLFTEVDWSAGPPFGTAIPLKLLDVVPPEGGEELLAWLGNQEELHQTEIRANWEVVIGGRHTGPWK